MQKVLVIGIDALDSTTLSKYEYDLPSFSKLMNANRELRFDGVFPPDSPTSWASIYTGLNPAKHGIVLFTDPLKRVGTMVSKDVDDSSIRGRTFWDLASKAGKKVVILPHLLGYPPWDVNGAMIGRSGVIKDTQVRPSNLESKLKLDEFSWDMDLFPGKNKAKYLNAARKQISREGEFGKKMMMEFEWDLFFISFGELDSVQYSYWHYYDKADPDYPGKNRYENVIPDFYRLFDRIIGEMRELAGENCVTIVVSDHGIGSRPVKLLNINEVLRKNGFLSLRDQAATGKSMTRGRRLRNAVLKVISELDLGNIAAVALKLFPKSKDWFISGSQVDWSNSMAYLTDQSGIKNYPYGGIIICKSNLKGEEYEKIRMEIIERLHEIMDPDDGKPVFNWVKRREELYSGERISSYPDILFDMKEDYGAGNNVPAEIFGRSISHKIVPGCHKQHHSTFLISEISGKKVAVKEMNLMDVAPTILDLIEVLPSKDMDGRSILKPTD